MKNKFKEVIMQEDIILNDKQIDDFIQFASLLKEWNNKINLTSLNSDDDIIYKHFLDSLLCLKINLDFDSKKVIDIGTGAGFPGIPLKIANNSIDLTLFDSLQKRVKYLSIVVEKLALENVSCIHGRAEHFGKLPEFREGYDIALARAVARLPILLEYCLPFVKTGGYFIALKGSEAPNELSESAAALKLLGAETQDIFDFTLKDIQSKRKIIIFKKTAVTPDKFPRKAGIPTKRPLL